MNHLERASAALDAIEAIEGAGGTVHYHSVDLLDGETCDGLGFDEGELFFFDLKSRLKYDDITLANDFADTAAGAGITQLTLQNANVDVAVSGPTDTTSIPGRPPSQTISISPGSSSRSVQTEPVVVSR